MVCSGCFDKDYGRLKKGKKNEKYLIFLAFAILFLAWPLASFASGPFLVADTYAGADYFTVNGLPAAISASNIAPDSTGKYAFMLDLGVLPVGTYTVTAQACSAAWGVQRGLKPFRLYETRSIQSAGKYQVVEIRNYQIK